MTYVKSDVAVSIIKKEVTLRHLPLIHTDAFGKMYEQLDELCCESVSGLTDNFQISYYNIVAVTVTMKSGDERCIKLRYAVG